MKFQINVSKAARGHWNARRCTSMMETAFICAALFVASQSASQAAAQTRFQRGIAGFGAGRRDRHAADERRGCDSIGFGRLDFGSGGSSTEFGSGQPG